MSNPLNELKKKNKKKETGFQIFQSQKPGLRDITEFTKNLSVLINSRITLLKALETIHRQSGKPIMKKLTAELISDLKKGKSFSVALSLHYSFFDPVYIKLIEIGEESSGLGNVLHSQAEYMEKMYHLRQKLILSLMYPGFLILSSIIAVLFFILFILPSIAEIFTDFGAEIPLSVKLIIGFGKYLPIAIVGLVITIAVVYSVYRKNKLNWINIAFFRKIFYTVPFMAKTIQKIFISRYFRSAGLLIKNGMTISQALNISLSVTSDQNCVQTMQESLRSIDKGQSIFHSFKKSNLFPETVTELISAGETSGNLDEVFVYISEFYEKGNYSGINIIWEKVQGF